MADLDPQSNDELLSMPRARRRRYFREKERAELRGYALDKAAEARVDARQAAAEARGPDTRTIEQIEHDTEQWLADVEASGGGKLQPGETER